MQIATTTKQEGTAWNAQRGTGSGSKAKTIRWLPPIISGVLLALIFPKFNVWFLAWVALIPLLVSISRSETHREGFLSGLLAGLFYFGIVLYWIPRVLVHYGGLHVLLSVPIYLIMIVYLALFVGGFGLLLYRTVRGLGIKALFLAPAVWVSFELGRNYLAMSGFPWASLGYSQVRCLPLIQIADLTGVYGVSFLIAAVNALLAYLLVSRRRPDGLANAAGWSGPRTPSFKGFTIGSVALLVIGALIYGYGKSFEPYQTGSGPGLKVACIQADIPLDYDMEAFTKKFFVDYPRLIRSISPFGAKLIVLPESPTPFSFQHDEKYRSHMTALAREAKAWVLFNNISSSDEGAYFNSACLLSPAGELAFRYDKMHLVPFGEYVPMRNLLFFAGKVLKEVSDFRPGTGFVISDMGGTRFATFICFEGIFPELVREFPKRGAEFLINITNDSWYGNTAAPYQHFDMSVFRAIENRRYLVRAANSGFSGIVDPYGRVLKRSELFKEAAIEGEITPRRDLTFYARFGDVFAWFCVIISLGALFEIRKLKFGNRNG